MIYLKIIDSRKPDPIIAKTVDLAKCFEINAEPVEWLGEDSAFGKPKRILIERRASGPLKHRAFYLNDIFDWVLGRDPEGALVLVPQTR